MPLEIRTYITGLIATNTYLLRSGEECWVADPGGVDGGIIKDIGRRNLKLTRILLTHGHGDHIAGVVELKSAFPGALLCCPAGDADMLMDAERNLSAAFGLVITACPADQLVHPGAVLAMVELTWQVLDTCGHSPGGVSYYCAAAGVALTGDALFAGGIGRTDIPGASERRLLANIKTNLLTLPDDTRILPGHGPSGTIGQEKRTNPFLAGLAGL